MRSPNEIADDHHQIVANVYVPTRPTAGRIHDLLASELGSQVKIFRDVKDIEPGETFISVVEKAVEESDIFLVLIGSSWLDDLDRRQSDGLDDPVHFEIATAIRRKVPVIPILVDGARLPGSKELPDAIAPLSSYNGLTISNDHFEDGFARLVGTLRKRLPKRPFVQALRWSGLAVAMCVALALIWELTQSPSVSDVTSRPKLETSQESPAPVTGSSPAAGASSAAAVDAIDLLEGAWAVVDGAKGERVVFKKTPSGDVAMETSGANRTLGKTGDRGANIREKSSLLGDCYYLVKFPGRGRMIWTRTFGSSLFCLSDTSFEREKQK
jgi:hypothetical protein